MSNSTSTLQKALAVNLDQCKYGTLVEIGAGQEVARFFFQAGGAAGTIAKTMSAYDMQVSDAIYGAEEHGRYVSRSRLEKMLDRELVLVQERLETSRPRHSTFFAFADTVAAQGFRSRRECHGWMGIRLQLYPGAEPSQILIHVRMLDSTNRAQQEALGVLGVNLIHAAFFHYRDPAMVIESLTDNLSDGRIEIDMIDFSGPYFEDTDNRLMALHLTRCNLARAVMFSPSGEVVQPSDVLYKKNILALRGGFRPVTRVNLDMLDCGRERFFREPDVDPERTVVLAELTTAELMADGEVDPRDFLARVDTLNSLGLTVMVSSYLRFFRLRAYFNRYTKRRIGIVLGVKNVWDIFDEKFYVEMEGGTLEAFGKLFAGPVRLYVYPQIDGRTEGTGELITVDTMKVKSKIEHLFRHLTENRWIVPLEGYDRELLQYHSPEILRELKKGDGPWKHGVPDAVHRMIVEQRLFGYESERELVGAG